MSASPDAQKVSDTIGAIYDCAIALENWPTAIGKIGEVMNSSIGMLLRANPSLGVIRSVGHWGFDEQSFHAMEHEWGYKQPLNWHVKDAPIAEPFNLIQAAQAMEIDNLWEQPFFAEYSRPAGYGDAAVVVLYRTDYRILSLVMVGHSSEPEMSEERLDQLRLFVPHLQRAIRLSESIDRQSLAINAYERLLDVLGLPVILLNTRGRVLHANLAASDLLTTRDGLSLNEGKIRVMDDSEATERLSEAIGTVADRSASQVIEAVPFFDRSGEPLVAYVIGLGAGKVRGGYKSKEQIAVLVSAQNQARAPVESIGSLLGLTATENRVLGHIADGLNRQETATRMGVADSTVKSHLENIFAKTGMTSQSDILKTLSKLSVPLRVS